MFQNHPYHIVYVSPWPIVIGTLMFGVLLSSVKWFHFSWTPVLMLLITFVVLSSYQWWRDVCRESTSQGLHSTFVISNIRWGIILFITSEVLFFFSFFWAFFHSSLAPCVEIGAVWPPVGVEPLDPFQVPLLNTVILLSRGVTVTWTHHSLIVKDKQGAENSLALTVLLGIYFTALQAWEYLDSSFAMRDSVFGSTFFIATGFHGLHVIIGSLFLLVGWFRLKSGNFRRFHHIGLERAIWYWHFVDVVWLFLFSFVYWWAF